MASEINRALYAPRLWFGIQKTYAAIIMIAEIIVVALGSIPIKIAGSLFFVSVWVLLAHLNSTDPIFFTVLWRHLMRPKTYQAYAKFGTQYNKKVNYKAGK